MAPITIARATWIAALALGGAVGVAGCAVVRDDRRDSLTEAQALHDAVQQLTSVIVYDIFSPPQASRVYAYASVAAYETLRQGDSTFRTLAGQVNGLAPVPPPPADSVSLPLAGVHAFMTVGWTLTFSRARMDSLRTAMDERFRSKLSPPVYQRSIAYGELVAKHVLGWAAADGFTRSRGMPKYTVSHEPGLWVPTPPAYMDAVEPNWATLRPFAIDSAGQFRPPPPHVFDTVRTSPFMREAVEVYETGRTLTEEQRAIAAFWDCNPYVMNVQGHTMFATKKISPGGHWMGIVGIAARHANLDLPSAAEAYARTAMVLADGFIAAWEEKFRSRVIRPETVINALVDERWTPLLQTPPFPEYPSGHSVISTAAATVLSDLLGPRFAFEDSTEQAYGFPPRRFQSFEQAAGEAAISRLYGGIHYRRAIEEGVKQGRAVGIQHTRRITTRAGTRAARSISASSGE
jgi:hypothetical protein